MIYKNYFLFVIRYGIIGLIAASTHGIVLFSLLKIFPLWFSNLLGFLSASVVSYIGHATFTFRKETKGKIFAKRWLFSQFTLNIFVSSLLPIILTPWESLSITPFLLIITPTILNAFVWKKASDFSSKKQNTSSILPLIHADDLGLTSSTNEAIFNLFQSKELNSASLIVNGIEVDEAIHIWEQNRSLALTLHLCLTEGNAISSSKNIYTLVNKQNIFKNSFLNFLIASLLPEKNTYKVLLKKQLKAEISAQLSKFQGLTKITNISIDGHQHIHLIPIVLDTIIELKSTYNITWIRTTLEPFPSKMPFKYLIDSLQSGGFLKWAVLQILSSFAIPKIASHSLKTNASFAGILFTGKMIEPIINLYCENLHAKPNETYATQPLLLSHPAASFNKIKNLKMFEKFYLSESFAKSHWRQTEWRALKTFHKNANHLDS